jgi:DnaK suppressor protein
MDGSKLHRIREALMSRRSRIYEGGRHEPEEAASDATQSVEIIDIAQSLEHIDREKSLAEQERRDLRAIERALSKLSSGLFGVCEECGDEIPERRLMIVPEARLCTRCQAVEERQAVRVRHPGSAAK